MCDGVLEVADGRQHVAKLLRWILIEGSLLALHRLTGACGRPAGEALGHKASRADGAAGSEQMIGSLRPQAVRLLEEAVDVAQVELARERRELVHDHLWFGGRNRLGHRVGVESVGNDRARSEAANQVLLRRAPRHPVHLVAFRHELWDELSAEDAGGAGYEDLNSVLLCSSAPVRREKEPGRDSASCSAFACNNSRIRLGRELGPADLGARTRLELPYLIRRRR